MSKAINRAYADAIRAISDLRDEAESVEDELSRQREPIYATNPKGDPVVVGHMEPGPYIDGHPIEYWHQIATSTLKTNNELIDRVKALTQERDDQKINADHYFATRERIERENYTLRQSLKEKERINADLEQRLQTMGNSYLDELRRANHQAECAKTAQDERDTALRELDAMREKMNCTATPSMLDSILSRLDALEEYVNTK